MGEVTGIEWCDHTFNPWIGCTKVSPACDHCYAETLATARLGVAWGTHAERRRTADSNWRQPLAWNRKAERDGLRRRVFCASLADVFDNQVPAEWREDLWALIRDTSWLDWLLLTKRPQNLAKMLPPPWMQDGPWPWPNVWLGTTVENQAEADRRIPALLAVPAEVHFLSCEPLLGPVDLMPYLPHGTLAGAAIRWVIAGGESGPGARPSHPNWFRLLREQCLSAGAPYFFKQWGDWFPGELEDDGRRFVAVPDACHDPGAGRWEFGWAECFDGFDIGMLRLGKKRTGAMLDGREWREVPR